jgi:4-aminobutyrate aminotransferase-like enzyme
MYKELPGPKSWEYLRRAMKVFPGGDSPDAEKKFVTNATFFTDRAEDSYLYDVDGYKYIDFFSGWASNNLGNVHPEIYEAVVDALSRYGFVYNHIYAIELAEKLIEITPKNLTRVSFEVSGTEAAEASVSYALTHTKRPLIITFIGQFHGDSIGARNLGSETAERKSYFEAMHGGVIFIPYPKNTRIPLNMTIEEYAELCLWFIEENILRYVSEPSRIAGILFEPMMAEGGNIIPPKNFIEGLRKMADRYGWLLLDDEVLTGFGRTGKMWGIEHYNIKVDIIVTGKGLTGGMIPIGAVVGSEEIMGPVKAYSGSTFAGSPAGCAAALKTIEIIYRDNILDKVSKNGEEALKIMREWVDKYNVIGDARGVGYLLGVEVITGLEEKIDEEIARRIFVEATKYGVRGVWDEEPTIRIYPPLNITKELLHEGLQRFEEAIKKIEDEFKHKIGS